MEEREKISCARVRVCMYVSIYASAWAKRRKGEARFSRSLALTHGRSFLPAAILCSPVDPAFPTTRGKYWPTMLRDSMPVERYPRDGDTPRLAERSARRRRTRTNASRHASTTSCRLVGTRRRSATSDNSFHVGSLPWFSSRPRYSRARKYENTRRVLVREHRCRVNLSLANSLDDLVYPR